MKGKPKKLQSSSLLDGSSSGPTRSNKIECRDGSARLGGGASSWTLGCVPTAPEHPEAPRGSPRPPNTRSSSMPSSGPSPSPWSTRKGGVGWAGPNEGHTVRSPRTDPLPNSAPHPSAPSPNRSAAGTLVALPRVLRGGGGRYFGPTGRAEPAARPREPVAADQVEESLVESRGPRACSRCRACQTLP